MRAESVRASPDAAISVPHPDCATVLQLEKALAASENKKSSLNERNSQLLAEVAQYLLQITKCEQENSALQLARTSLEGCEGKAQQEVTALRIEISQLQSQLQEAQRELHIANTQVSVCHCRCGICHSLHCTANTSFRSYCECRLLSQ